MNIADGFKPTIETVLQSPAYFLSGLNFDTQKLTFVRTGRSRVSNASFVDGRAALSDQGVSFSVDVAQALAWQEARQEGDELDRFIFHMSFCGSTLLARACDYKGKVMAYKEPQALIELADWRSLGAGHSSRQAFQCMRNFVLDQFQRSLDPDEVAVIKPSNWVNSFLPDLVRSRQKTRAVFVTIDSQDFLVAVLRGGRQRIEYTCRLLPALQQAMPEYDDVVNSGAMLHPDPFQKAARLILLVHFLQAKAFEKLQKSLLPDTFCSIGFASITEKPEDCLKEVSNVLELGLSDVNIQHNIKQVYQYHSKNEGELFTASRESEINQQVVSQYRPVIEAAMGWYESI